MRARNLLQYLAVFSAVVFVLAPSAKYAALRSNILDLGLFQAGLFTFSQVGEWQQAFYGHAHVFLPLLAEIYGHFDLFHAPFFLVAMQAVLLIIPVVAFWRLFGPLPAFAYLAYAPLWSNALFDFHFDHLAVPLLLGFFLTVQNRRLGLAILTALLLMFIKELFALQTATCGAFLVWAAFSNQLEKKWFVGGVLLILVGLSYFYFVAHYAFPYFTTGERSPLDTDAFSWLGHGLFEMMWTIITQLHLVLWDIISTPKKLVYLFVVFGSLAFIPLLRPAYLIPTLPLLMVAMLSRLENYYSYTNHYTAGLIVPVMFSFVHGLPVAERWWLSWSSSLSQHAGLTRYSLTVPVFNISIGFVNNEQRKRFFYALLCIWILIGHIMLSPSPISRLFWSDKVWSISWRAYVPTSRDAMMKTAMEKFIPADPKVSVAAQNTVNWAHLAHREVYLPFPAGVVEPHKTMDWSNRTLGGLWEFVRSGYMPPMITRNHYASYVVLDLKRPYFLLDQGCEWIYSECRNKEMERKFLEWVAYTRRFYDTVFEQDGFIIFRRRGEQE